MNARDPRRPNDYPNRAKIASLVALFILSLSVLALAQPPGPNEMPSVVTVPAAAQPSDHFDATAATNAYWRRFRRRESTRSDAYFEGGYWLMLWDFLYGVVIALLLLTTRWSAAMRDLAERMTRFKPLQTFIYWVEYLIVTTILGFPLAVYEGYFREHKYGMATQTFGPWIGRPAQESWRRTSCWAECLLWFCSASCDDCRATGGSGVRGDVIVFMIFVILIAPVFIVPHFQQGHAAQRSENHRANSEPGARQWDPRQKGVHD